MASTKRAGPNSNSRASAKRAAGNRPVPFATHISVSYVSIDWLKPAPDNPHVHSPKQICQIVASILVFGFIVPILIDCDGNVIAGHGRYLAAIKLGLKEVPTICLDHLTAAQRRAFMIADNKLTHNASRNEQLLGQIFLDLSKREIDFDLTVTGFEIAEIDLKIEGLSDNNNNQPDAADDLPEVAEKPVSRPGDLWLLGNHRVLCGSALDSVSYVDLMGDAKAAMVITDVPYNVKINGHVSGLGKVRHREFAMASGEMTAEEFLTFLTDGLNLTVQNSVDGSLHYIFMDWRHMGELLAAGDRVYTGLNNLCVWAKTNAGMGSMYRFQHELVFVFKHGTTPHLNNIQLGRFGRLRSNVWTYPGMNGFGRAGDEGDLAALHPTVKPVAMISDAILDCTKRSNIVLDPFLGSGTTVIAAERTGRICYGIEIDPLYVDVIIRRWQNHTGGVARHAVTGLTFDETAAMREAGNV